MRAIPDPKRGFAIAAACAALMALVLLGLEVLAYETARERWRTISEHVEDAGAETYDGAASDARYDEVRARRAGAKQKAWIAAAMLVLAASGAGRRTSPTELGDPPHARVLAASVLDVTLTALALAAALGIARSSSSIAAGDALAILAPALVVAAMIAMVARGATPAQRALGLTLAPTPGPLRAALVIALLPVAALWLVVGGLPLALLMVAGRTPRAAFLAPHVALAGVRVVHRGTTTTEASEPPA